MERYEAHQVDLTGCTLDQVLYVIQPGLPCDRVGGFEPCGAADGYTMTDITYIDPDDGKSHTAGISALEKQTESSGNVFIGYIK